MKLKQVWDLIWKGQTTLEPEATEPARHPLVLASCPLGRERPGDSGYDLRATESVVLHPGQRAVVPTGCHLAMPDCMEAQVRGRSGLAARHGIMVAMGTVDSGYRGEVRVVVTNTDRDEIYEIEAGERIAQLVFAAVIHPAIAPCAPEDMPGSDRGTGGFGSTGR